MTPQVMTRLLENCRKLVGHARGAGRRVAEALGERFGGRPAAGGGFVDVHTLHLAVADELEAMDARLEAWTDRYRREVERGRRLRDRREGSVAELRSRLLRLKSSLAGAFDHGAAGRLLRRVRRLETEPDALRQQAAWLHATLTDPELELPAPRPGVELDLALAAKSFEQPMKGLGETLAELIECEAAASHAKAQRDEVAARLTVFLDQAARFYQSLCELARHQRIAPLRQAVRHPGRPDPARG